MIKRIFLPKSAVRWLQHVFSCIFYTENRICIREMHSHLGNFCELHMKLENQLACLSHVSLISNQMSYNFSNFIVHLFQSVQFFWTSHILLSASMFSLFHSTTKSFCLWPLLQFSFSSALPRVFRVASNPQSPYSRLKIYLGRKMQFCRDRQAGWKATPLPVEGASARSKLNSKF